MLQVACIRSTAIGYSSACHLLPSRLCQTRCCRYEGVTVTSDREPVILMRLYRKGSLAKLVQGGMPLPVEQALG
jgi:hypothetical protein